VKDANVVYNLFSLGDTGMWFPRFALLGFATQLPFMSAPPMSTIKDFELKTGKDRFSPKDLIELPRPSTGEANAAGDLVLASVSKYSFEEKMYENIPICCDCTSLMYCTG